MAQGPLFPHLHETQTPAGEPYAQVCNASEWSRTGDLPVTLRIPSKLIDNKQTNKLVGLSPGWGDSYWLDDKRHRSSSLGNQEFPSLDTVHTGSEGLSDTYPMSTGGFSRGIKKPVREADNTLPSTPNVKKP